MSSPLTNAEMAKVQAKYPVSQTVMRLSLGTNLRNDSVSSVPKTASGQQATLCGVAPEKKNAGTCPGEQLSNARRAIREAKTRYAGREGKRAFLQKLQACDCSDAERGTPGTTDIDHEARGSGTHGGNHGVFRVTIKFRMADRGRKDLDGAVSTLLDCLIRARRRLLDPDSNPPRKRRSGSWKRRSGDHYRTPVGNKVPF